jgi:hypothetical protein
MEMEALLPGAGPYFETDGVHIFTYYFLMSVLILTPFYI